jgi:non-ribosomal peptide synthetase component F
MKFIVSPLGNRTIVCAYKIAEVAVSCATTTDRPPVETIERSSRRGMWSRTMEPQYGTKMSNLALKLVASAARIPGRTVAITSEQTMTYTELDSASARLATLLQRDDIGVGDRLPTGPTGKLLRREVIPPPIEEA